MVDFCFIRCTTIIQYLVERSSVLSYSWYWLMLVFSFQWKLVLTGLEEIRLLSDACDTRSCEGENGRLNMGKNRWANLNQYCHQFDGTSQEERNSVQRNTVSFNPTFLLALDFIFFIRMFSRSLASLASFRFRSSSFICCQDLWDSLACFWHLNLADLNLGENREKALQSLSTWSERMVK